MAYRELAPQEINRNPFTMIGKEWMLVTAEKDGKVNTMTASWGGMGVVWNKNVAYVLLRPQRYTKEFIDAGERFTLSFYDEEYRKALAYLGKVSGRDEDKIATVGFEIRQFGSAPAFKQANLVLCCKKLFNQPIDPAGFVPGLGLDEKNYPNKDYHTLYIAEIEAVYEKE